MARTSLGENGIPKAWSKKSAFAFPENPVLLEHKPKSHYGTAHQRSASVATSGSVNRDHSEKVLHKAKQAARFILKKCPDYAFAMARAKACFSDHCINPAHLKKCKHQLSDCLGRNGYLTWRVVHISIRLLSSLPTMRWLNVPLHTNGTHGFSKGLTLVVVRLELYWSLRFLNHPMLSFINVNVAWGELVFMSLVFTLNTSLSLNLDSWRRFRLRQALVFLLG